MTSTTGSLPSYTQSLNDQFPTICQKCLGEQHNSQQYLSLIRSTMGSECKLCQRVYTSYRFKQHKSASRFVHTEICKTCSTMKNICQCCLLDLDFHVPFFMRDAVNNEHLTDQNIMGHNNELMHMFNAEKLQSVLDDKSKLALHHRNADSNQHHNHLLNQLKKPFSTEFLKGFRLPQDKRIKTLYVGPFDHKKHSIDEHDLRKNFLPYGPLRHIKLKPANNCALVTFLNRQDAELAAEALYGGILTINDVKLNVQFVKKKTPKSTQHNNEDVQMEDVDTRTTQQHHDSDMEVDTVISKLQAPDRRLLAYMQLPEKKRPPLPKELPGMLIPPHVLENIAPPPGKDDHVYPSQRMDVLQL